MTAPTGVIGDLLQVSTWEEYVGQKDMKKTFDVVVRARLKDGRPMDPILLSGPPGYGKTSLAKILADLLGDEFVCVRMPINPREFYRILREIEEGVVVLDELHSAPPAFQQSLQFAIANGVFELPDGNAVSTKWISFIGTTTDPKSIIQPLMDRFICKPPFVDYSDEEMAIILRDMAKRIGVSLSDEMANRLCRAAAGTPRLAGSLVAAVRDLELIGVEPTPEAVLAQVHVDEDGLSHEHLAYLRVVYEQDKNTAGLSTLCSMLQISAPMVERLERLLRARKLVRFDETGRHLTPKGRERVERDQPARTQRRRRSA